MILGHQIGLVGDMTTPQSLARLIDDFFGDVHRLAMWQDNLSTARKRVCWEEEEKKLLKIYAALQ
jgi:hypothetical protein